MKKHVMCTWLVGGGGGEGKTWYLQSTKIVMIKK